MSTEQALLAAVWEHPHDDTPRLVYADWLEETGEPDKAARAEFIRVQCELARLDDGVWWYENEPAASLTKRVYQLWRKRAAAWKAGLPKALSRADFRRGFPYPNRTVRSTRFGAVSAAEWAAAPLWKVSITRHSRQAWRDIPANPALLRIDSLNLWPGGLREPRLHPDDAVRLARSPYLVNLSELNLASNRLGLEPVRALLFSGGLPHLTGLHLASCRCGDGVVTALLESTLPDRLTSLSLLGNDLSPDALGRLLASGPRFGRLRLLDLRLNRLTERNLQFLAGNPPFPALVNLGLEGDELGDEGAAALAGWAGGATLRHLHLIGKPEIGPIGARALATSPHLAGLRSLRVRTARGGEPGAYEILLARFGARFHPER